MARHTLSRDQVGVHVSLSTSRQISPRLKWILGWQIGVTKVNVGGEWGYVGGTTIFNWKRAFSNGVSGGPRMKAIQWNRSVSCFGNRIMSVLSSVVARSVARSLLSLEASALANIVA